jgi:uncharacterized membrane protein YdjX (TVP38/TMEM64 family)
VNRKHVERALAAFLLALGAAGFYWLHVRSGLEWRPEALRDYVATLGMWGPLAFIAIMALRPFLVLPSWLVLFACGMLFGPWLGAVYGAFGGLIGGAMIFFVARAFGRDAVQGRIGGALRIFDELLARRGAPWLALYTAVPISPLTPVYASAGVSRMNVVPFCFAIGLGLLPRAGVYTFAGQATSDPSVVNIALAVAIGLGAVAITWRMRRSFKNS